ncbi:amino acid transporter [Pleomassaria siparia CBS 279.74]|uniref:Amino acid transporter n=1 Tax=Pleomassaria siparia CBS 279.74 TaxID=1314801 RepID=A0A6G1JUM4_9PLEO|nr:amino acid transporter [Pleomassaria siparia CBS 279.74]
MRTSVELQTLDEEVHFHRGKHSVSESKMANDFDRDRYELARAGKQQVLKRRFGLVSMTGLSCGLMCTWESLLVVFGVGFQNGGPAGLIYGFLLIWLGNISVFIVIGELSSAIPTAGGQYHWVSVLAPRSSRKFFSYITGWLTVIGWIAALTSVSFFVADLTLQLVKINEDFVKTGWQGTLVLWATLVLCIVINVFISGALPSIEVVILIIHILGFFGIIIPLVYLTPTHNSAKEILTTFSNNGAWNSRALAFFIGLQGNALAFVGTDSAVHMSEEVKNASTDVARSMLLSLGINGVLAFGMLFAVLFSVPIAEIMTILTTSEGFPVIHIFKAAVGSTAGATIMTSIIIVLEFCSALGCLAAASRMTWSFARDRGLPFSRYISMIDKRTTIPVVAIVVVTLCSALLALINIGNNVAFNGTISLVLEGFYLSYLLAIGLFLWRRMRGDMDNPDPVLSFNSATHSDETLDTALHWGPWRLKGYMGIANNIVACSYLLLLIFFSFWPTQLDVSNAEYMNWAVLVTGFILIFSIGYYLIWAKQSYTGPIVEVDPHTL